jgi:hypothetical protein
LKLRTLLLIVGSLIAAIGVSLMMMRRQSIAGRDPMMRSVPSQSQARPKTANNESSTGSSNKVSGQQQTPVGSLSESSSNGSVGTATSIAASQPSLHLPTPHLVGKEVCQECHQENFQLHSAHGHAHTFHVLDDSPDIIAKFAAKSFHAGEEFGTYEYQAEFGTIDAPEKLKKLKATLPAVFGDEPFPLQYALGSGHNAYTLLTLITEENGNTAALEHRTSWYAAQGGLNITPGHTNKHPANGLELFGSISRDEVMEKCIDCHTTSAEIVGEEIKNLIPSVNCEKCHGPGSEHVRLARAQATPPPYSVGKDDWDTEAEIQLCGDCHRLPKNITEKELREYPDLLARFQPIGLLRSKCYLESEGQMRCTTCHGPHEALHQVPADRHIQNCLNCHNAPEHTLCPVSPKDNCIQCHMPPMTQEQGLTFHDHWIRVRKE